MRMIHRGRLRPIWRWSLLELLRGGSAGRGGWDGKASMTFFKLDRAVVWRGETRALDQFSLELRLGESVMILGPNGAGKSTLLRVLCGELYPEYRKETTCELFGESRWSLEALRHRMGVVMPDDVRRFAPDELVGDVVLSSLRAAFGRTRFMRFSEEDEERAAQAMAWMGIESFAQREFGRLSSGEQRRCLVARALVHDPEVLVLDEPSTALDLAAAVQMTQRLRQLMGAGKTLVWVTHHPSEIPPELSRAVILKDGTVFAEGPKEQVIHSAALSEVFGVALEVRWSDGWCQVAY